MKLHTLIWLLSLLLIPTTFAYANLDGYLEELTISARGNLGDFNTQLAARFGLSLGEVEVVISNVDRPADAALLLWLTEKSHQPRNRVMDMYREKKGHGWGAIAKSLGIRPGSDEFRALKAGRLDFSPTEHGNSGILHKATKNHGKNHSKKHGKSK